EVAQAAMDELGGGRRGGAAQIGLLAQEDRQAPPRRIAGNAAAIDAAADDGEIEGAGRQPSLPGRPALGNAERVFVIGLIRTLNEPKPRRKRTFRKSGRADLGDGIFYSGDGSSSATSTWTPLSRAIPASGGGSGASV